MAQQYNVPFHPRVVGGGGGGCSNTPTYLQRIDDGTASAITKTYVFPGNITAGSTIICDWRTGGTGISPTVSDTLGNTYTQDKTQVATGDHEGWVFRAYSTSGGANTVTIDRHDAGGSIRGSCHEYSNIASSSPVLDSASNQGTSTTPDSGSGAGFTCAHNLLFGAFTYNNNAISFTPGNMGTGGAATARGEYQSGVDIRTNAEELTSAGSGTYKADATTNQSVLWTAIFVAYKGS